MTQQRNTALRLVQIAFVATVALALAAPSVATVTCGCVTKHEMPSLGTCLDPTRIFVEDYNGGDSDACCIRASGPTCNGVQCADGQVCNSVCQSCTSDSQCSSGQECISGSCVIACAGQSPVCDWDGSIEGLCGSLDWYIRTGPGRDTCVELEPQCPETRECPGSCAVSSSCTYQDVGSIRCRTDSSFGPCDPLQCLSENIYERTCECTGGLECEGETQVKFGCGKSF